MKTKKVVVGTMAAAILSLTLNALPVAYAAGETVQISVGSATAEPGQEFSVDVTLSDIPSTGIQACDFTVQYDSSLITVTSVTAGALTETGASENDSTASMLANFGSKILAEEGKVNLTWTTSLDDSSYWLQGSGVLCTITGTVAEDAASGTTADLKVVATDRESYPGSGAANTNINCGYTDGTNVIRYEVSVADGAVSIGSSSEIKYGDADCNGIVELNDAVLIMCNIADEANNPITAQGRDNADVYQRGDGVNNMDALAIQKSLAQLIPELPESVM